MMNNIYKTTIRSLARNKVFSLLNISGLAIGMATCFFIFHYVYFEMSYEKYNPNADNIYRLDLQYKEGNGDSYVEATNNPAVGPALKENFPEVISYTRLIPLNAIIGTTTISRQKKRSTIFSGNEKNIFQVDATTLKMFAVSMIYGDASTALSQMHSIVLSASTAKKYFGDENPMNKIIHINGGLSATVTGVFKDLPENTHIKFDMLLAFAEENAHAENWDWPEFYTYIMLAPGTDPSAFQKKMPTFMNKYAPIKTDQNNAKNNIFLQPIKDIHLKSHYRKELEPNSNNSDIVLLSILSIFVLLIAYINYVNLSTAKVMERASEVGIRKIMGASKIQLIRQFLTEALVINCISLVLAILLVLSLAPAYQTIVGKPIDWWFWMSGLFGEIKFWTLLLLILVGGSFLVGIYPALLMSKYNPVFVLKGKFYGSHNGIMVRRILTSFQFMLSIILIAGSLVVFYQLQFMRNQSLGYTKDQVLVVKTPGVYHQAEIDNIKTLQSELLNNAAIKNVSLSTDVPGEAITSKVNVRIPSETLTNNTGTLVSSIDEHFFNTYGIHLSTGRNFKQTDAVDIFPIDEKLFPKITPIVVNESFIHSLGFKTGNDALGKLVSFNLTYHELKGEIIGVINNYHQTSLKDPYLPTMYIYQSRRWEDLKYYSLNIPTKNLDKTITLIQHSYAKLFPGNPFEYFFQNEYFNKQYKSEQRFAKIFNGFTALSIFISCLGLLGLLSFTIALRSKEIGIRRVLGASVNNILVLFFRDYFKVIAMSTLIALPIIYYAGNMWLNNYAFHTTLNMFVFIVPPAILITITIAAVIAQSLKAAVANPITSLRDE